MSYTLNFVAFELQKDRHNSRILVMGQEIKCMDGIQVDDGIGVKYISL